MREHAQAHAYRLNSTYLSHHTLSPFYVLQASLSPGQDSRHFRHPFHDDTASHPASSSALPCDTRSSRVHYALRHKCTGAARTHFSTAWDASFSPYTSTLLLHPLSPTRTRPSACALPRRLTTGC
ncbi:hypothetical protein HYPSUDRAFT_39504 [Hypholoma sublateritium FD-334 SS-4]|uniref:Uncharacterized protein n=1 Tax=Hypholoma sublateritium (strain FD-334 SS-4) TaxID=945553 RepID=A0A0D2PVZ0_HYPSF|nr:hypothetical protein HYPSUDRAFT_39504 [Hypholoma sublateritium FD-334 SS-4]